MPNFMPIIRSRKGVAGMTYAVIVGLIAVVAILAITQVGKSVSTLMSGTANRMGAAVNASGAADGGAPVTNPNARIYSESFTNGSPITSQCSSFSSWRATLTGTYTKVTLRGTGDPVGVSCTGATADTLCQALRTNTTTARISCDGRSWQVYPNCLTGNPSIAADASLQSSCHCPALSDLYVVRPCHHNYGAINGSSCNAGMPSGTLSIVCE